MLVAPRTPVVYSTGLDYTLSPVHGIDRIVPSSCMASVDCEQLIIVGASILGIQRLSIGEGYLFPWGRSLLEVFPNGVSFPYGGRVEAF